MSPSRGLLVALAIQPSFPGHSSLSYRRLRSGEINTLITYCWLHAQAYQTAVDDDVQNGDALAAL